MNRLSHHIQKRVLTQATRNCRQHQQQAQRTFAVYTFGEGWTGALGTGSFDDISPDDPDGSGLYELKIPPSANNTNDNNTKTVVRAAAAGWGHTALIVEDQNQNQSSSEDEDDASNRRLLLCGRPHEFRTLLRLKRLPYFVRNMAVQSSFQHAFQTRMWDHEQEQQTTTTNIEQTSTKAEDASPLSSLVSSWSAFGRKEMWKFDEATNFTDSLSSILPELTEFSLPDGDTPAIPDNSDSTTTNNMNGIIDASAGFTALIGQSGKLYTLGLNPYGQCGVGEECNNVWTPSAVLGLSSQYASDTRDKLVQEYPIKSVSLGLQHAIAIDEDGTMYGWGKGERGQLGNDSDSVPHASLIHVRSNSSEDRDVNSHLTEREYRRLNRRKYVSSPILKVSNISSGFNHSACVTTCNQVFVWGKNTSMEDVVTKTMFGKEQTRKRFQDSHQPIPITGLPTSTLKVVDVTCGSHHTAILMEDGSVYGIGIATDNGDAILGEAVLMFPPGRVQMPVRQFTSHFDRTTIVSGDGREVLEVHLWSHEDLRLDWTMVSSVPDWFERLIELRGGRETRVKMVEKGWLHTVIVTDEDDYDEEEVS